MASDIRFIETIGGATGTLRLQFSGTQYADSQRVANLRAGVLAWHKLMPISSLRFWHKASAAALDWAYEVTAVDPAKTWIEVFHFASTSDLAPAQDITIAGMKDAELAPNRDLRKQLVALFVESGLFDCRFTYP